MSDRWPKATKESPCPRCGKFNRCLIAPDGTGGLCWRSGSKEVWQANGTGGGSTAANGNYYDFVAKNGKPSKPDQEPTPRPSYQVRSFVSATDAVVAATPKYQDADGNWLTAEFGNLWEYPDDDTVVYPMVVARYNLPDGSKQFRPVYRAENGWRIGDPPGLLPLYKSDVLPETSGSDGSESGQLIFVLEGEKCCDLARELDFAAVASAHGSNAAEKTDWTPLAGRDVVIIPDNDAAGEAYAKQVAGILGQLSCRTKIVKLPGVPPGGDIEQFDQLVASSSEATREALLALVAGVKWVGWRSLVVGPIVTCLAEVKMEPINWLWQGRIAIGKAVLWVGAPGDGKGTVAADIAARVSTGSPMPDGEPGMIGDVLMIASEDGLSDMLAPRCEVASADLRRIHHVAMIRRTDGESGKSSEMLLTLDNVVAIESVLDGIKKRGGDTKLLIVDPVGNHIGERTDTDRDNKVRAVLTPLCSMAERYNLALVLIVHRRKSAGGTADETAMGSRAYTGLARAVFHFGRDKQNRELRYFLAGKSNLSKEAPGLSFRIADEKGIGKVIWDKTPVELSADDMTAPMGGDGRMGPEPEQREAAMDFLRTILVDGPMPTADVKSQAGQAGLAWRTVRRAGDALRVRRDKIKFGPGWQWSLPASGLAATYAGQSTEILTEISTEISTETSDDQSTKQSLE